MKDLLKDATLIDVRTPQEYATGHVGDAENIPLDQVGSRIEEFKKMKKPIILYCRSGNRSGMATSILKQKGLTEVYNGGSLDEILNQLK